MPNTKKFIGSCSLALMSVLLFQPAPATQAQELVAPTASEATPTAIQDTTTTTAPATTQNASTTTTEAQAPTTEPTIMQAAAEPTTTATEPIVILHTNDMHGRMEEEKAKDGSTSTIGLAKLDALVKAEEAKADQTTYLLDAGDAFQGLPISNNSKGEEMAKLMNEIGYDAMAVGNHEFDFGLDQLKRYKEVLNVPLLSSNIFLNGAKLFDSYKILDNDQQKNGDELVVIGVSTPETMTKTHPNNLVGVEFGDPLTEVTKVIAELAANTTASSIKNYVILSHLGIDETTQETWRGNYLLTELLKNPFFTDKNLVLIDGHSHSVETNKLSEEVVYNQTGTALKNLGKVVLSGPGAIEASLIPASEASTITPTQAIAEKVAAIKQEFKDQTSTVILDNNPYELNGDRSNVRVRQTNLGDAVADAMYHYDGFTDTDLAVTNGGGLRATIKAGQPITEYDIISVLPFGNIIAQIEVTGQTIQNMFTHALEADLQKDDQGNLIFDENLKEVPLLSAAGSFLHIAGARVYYNPQAATDSRVLSIDILDRKTNQYVPLDLTKNYHLATNDFLAVGGDGYTMLGGTRLEGPSLDAVFADYIKSLGSLEKYQVINAYDRIIAGAKPEPKPDPKPEPKPTPQPSPSPDDSVVVVIPVEKIKPIKNTTPIQVEKAKVEKTATSTAPAPAVKASSKKDSKANTKTISHYEWVKFEKAISGLEAWVSTKDLAEKIQLIIKDLKASAHGDIVKVLEAFNLVYQVSFEVNGKEVTKVNEPVRIEVLLEADKEVAKVQSFDLEKKEVKEELNFEVIPAKESWYKATQESAKEEDRILVLWVSEPTSFVVTFK